MNRDPWLSLPFEALEAVTVHMMAVASSIYYAAGAPPGLLATLNGPVGSFHYSFCRFRITLLRYSKKLI